MNMKRRKRVKLEDNIALKWRRKGRASIGIKLCHPLLT